MNEEDARVAANVAEALPAIARAVEAIAGRLEAAGRWHSFGAGTSGWLAWLDAGECPPTFGVDPGLVTAHVAGAGSGDPSREAAAEDGAADGAQAAAALGPGDVALGVSASGETPYVVGALTRARELGALVVAVSNNPGTTIGRLADVAIEVPVGPEVLAGSTRLKSGTAQKMVLNMLSTAAFARLGLVYRGRMVGVVAANDKLRRRATGIVADLAGVGDERAAAALEAAGGDVRVAVVVASKGISADEAASRLRAAGGRLDGALGEAGA